MELSEEDKKFIAENIPHPYNTPERFGEFILPQIQIHDVLCTSTKATVKKLLAPLKKQYGHRFFCDIDDSHRQKSPASIIDKIRRSQAEKAKPGEPEPERYDLNNFVTKMTDLARFRVVCNFLSDVYKVAEAVRNSEELTNAFHIKEESTIFLRPKTRRSGERSTKFVLELKNQPGLFLEIQVMTQLQEAWDKKDHFLVYEQRRKFPDKDEEIFPDFLDAKMFSTAELLFVADDYFEYLRGAREDGKSDEEDK
jgi:ppGpp synthetase/RelA/SpoT-type nucleotidyltranferase